MYNVYGSTVKPRIPSRGGTKRGRPRGSRRMSSMGRNNPISATISNGGEYCSSQVLEVLFCNCSANRKLCGYHNETFYTVFFLFVFFSIGFFARLIFTCEWSIV